VHAAMLTGGATGTE